MDRKKRNQISNQFKFENYTSMNIRVFISFMAESDRLNSFKLSSAFNCYFLSYANLRKSLSVIRYTNLLYPRAYLD